MISAMKLQPPGIHLYSYSYKSGIINNDIASWNPLLMRSVCMQCESSWHKDSDSLSLCMSVHVSN